jgi:hypothetical protein
MSGALIVATGPSLTCEDVAAWSPGRIVYGVNDAYRVCAPHILYACDLQWWDVHYSCARHFGEQRWTCNDEAAAKYGLHHVPGRHGIDKGIYFDATGEGIIYGGNSGFQALNLAYMHGHRDAVLLGFDVGRAPDQPTHFFGEHPPACANPSPFNAWLKHWRRAAPQIAAAGMTVCNATRGGALDCFPRVALEEQLARL